MAPSPVRRRPRHRREIPTRLLVVTALVVVTAGIGAWFLLGRGGNSEQSNGYVSVEKRYANAAWAVHYTPLVVQQFSELDTFNAALDERAVVMEQSISEFDQIAKEEEGKAAALARESVNLAQEGLRAVSDFRDAIVTTNNLAEAHDALGVLETVVDELEANVNEWRQL